MKRTTLSALILSTAFSFGTFGASIAQTALPAVFTGAAAGQGIYVDAAFYNGIAGQPGVKLVDQQPPRTTPPATSRERINIPNSVLSITIGELRNQLPAWDVLEATFRRRGLSHDDTIVIYGDNLAGRSFIALRPVRL